MIVSLRSAHAADAPALAALARRTFCETFVEDFAMNYPQRDLQLYLDRTYAADAVQAWLAADGEVIVAEGDGKALLGYAQTGANELPCPEASDGDRELKRLYVLRSAQGTGLGRRLADQILAPLAHRRILLSVWSGNHKARRFYERYGFRAVGRNAFRVGDHVDDDLIYLRDPLAAAAAAT